MSKVKASGKVPLFEIYGGKHISDRKIGDDLTNNDLWDTYLHYPGTRMAVNRMNRAMFHNGFTYEIDSTYKIELMKGSIYKDLFGYACYLKEGDFIQAWMPLTNGIGFEMIDFDDKGRATELRITVQPKIGRNDQPLQFYVDRAYPEEGITDGFYMIRTILGAPGERGLSLISHLVDRFRNQTEILNKHGKFAENQAIVTPLHKYKNYVLNKQRIDDNVRALTDDDAIIMEIEEDFDYKSPQLTERNYIDVLDKEDEMIARARGINKHMLTGDPEGYLTSSITATANWYAYVIEQQEILLPQIQPILRALGGKEDVQFRSPEEYSLEQMANGILLIRKALEGLAPREQIIDVINDKFALKGDNQLRLADKEEWSNYEGNNENKIKRFQDKEGNEYEYRAQSNE